MADSSFVSKKTSNAIGAGKSAYYNALNAGASSGRARTMAKQAVSQALADENRSSTPIGLAPSYSSLRNNSNEAAWADILAADYAYNQLQNRIEESPTDFGYTEEDVERGKALKKRNRQDEYSSLNRSNNSLESWEDYINYINNDALHANVNPFAEVSSSEPSVFDSDNYQDVVDFYNRVTNGVQNQKNDSEKTNKSDLLDFTSSGGGALDFTSSGGGHVPWTMKSFEDAYGREGAVTPELKDAWDEAFQDQFNKTYDVTGMVGGLKNVATQSPKILSRLINALKGVAENPETTKQTAAAAQTAGNALKDQSENAANLIREVFGSTEYLPKAAQTAGEAGKSAAKEAEKSAAKEAGQATAQVADEAATQAANADITPNWMKAVIDREANPETEQAAEKLLAGMSESRFADALAQIGKKAGKGNPINYGDEYAAAIKGKVDKLGEEAKGQLINAVENAVKSKRGPIAESAASDYELALGILNNAAKRANHVTKSGVPAPLPNYEQINLLKRMGLGSAGVGSLLGGGLLAEQAFLNNSDNGVGGLINEEGTGTGESAESGGGDFYDLAGNPLDPALAAEYYYNWVNANPEWADQHASYADREKGGFTELRKSHDMNAWADLLGLGAIEGSPELMKLYRESGVDLDAEDALEQLETYLYVTNVLRLADYAAGTADPTRLGKGVTFDDASYWLWQNGWGPDQLVAEAEGWDKDDYNLYNWIFAHSRPEYQDYNVWGDFDPDELTALWEKAVGDKDANWQFGTIDDKNEAGLRDVGNERQNHKRYTQEDLANLYIEGANSILSPWYGESGEETQAPAFDDSYLDTIAYYYNNAPVNQRRGTRLGYK